MNKRIVSESTREKLRQAATGRIFSDETKAKMSMKSFGRKHTEETKEKLRQIGKNKIVSFDTCEKISNALKGHSVSEETKKKISQSSMGKKGTYGNLGKKHTIEARKKMSDSRKGSPVWNKGLTKETDSRLDFERPTVFKEGHTAGVRFGRDRDYSGENHYNWQDGKSKEPYGLGCTNKLKESIRERDDYCCQMCGKPQEKSKTALSVHHIDWSKKNLNHDNLIALCRRCHTFSHRHNMTQFKMLSQLAQ